MKPLVIYHSADFDGLFCREIARRYFGDRADYLGWDYGEAEPVVAPERELYILDLSVPGLMAHPRLVWIDHHKTAMEQYPATIPGYRIDGVAACRLAWQWFNFAFGPHSGAPVGEVYLPDKADYIRRAVTEPYAVQLAGEFDIWDKRNPDAETFQHALRAQELTDHIWRQLLSVEVEEVMQYQHSAIMVGSMLPYGRALEYARKHENESVITKQGFTVEFEGRRFLALNTARSNSLTFLKGLTPEHEGCLSFNWTGKEWRVSLYGVPARPEIDFSEIARKYGGGGHRQACGFKTKVLPFVQQAA